MFDDIRAELKDIRESANDVILRINRITRIQNNLDYKLQRLQREYAEVSEESDTPPSNIDALNAVREVANSVLLEELHKAVLINTEFDTSIFLERLESVCSNPRSIDIQLSGNQLLVNIRLNETAGTLEDYANAIKATRDNLPNSSKSSASMASHFWKEKFYRPAREGTTVYRRKYNKATKEYEKRDVTEEQVAKYWSTIQARLSASGKTAPFWEILDQGTPSMSSDEGGSAYPKNSRTDFTGKTISRLKRIFAENKVSQRDFSKELNEIKKDIDNISELMQEAQDLSDELSQAALDVQETLAKRLEDEYTKIDRDKIPNAEALIKKYREEGKARYTINGKQIRVKREINFLLRNLGNE
jgi:hypothetical protein